MSAAPRSRDHLWTKVVHQRIHTGNKPLVKDKKPKKKPKPQPPKQQSKEASKENNGAKDAAAASETKGKGAKKKGKAGAK